MTQGHIANGGSSNPGPSVPEPTRRSPGHAGGLETFLVPAVLKDSHCQFQDTPGNQTPRDRRRAGGRGRPEREPRTQDLPGRALSGLESFRCHRIVSMSQNHFNVTERSNGSAERSRRPGTQGPAPVGVP